MCEYGTLKPVEVILRRRVGDKGDLLLGRQRSEGFQFKARSGK
jgi:hypothetical protein